MNGIEKKPGGYVPESNLGHGPAHEHNPNPGNGPKPGHEPNPNHEPNPGRGSWEIIVNGRPHIFEKKEISFEEVITLAFGSYESAETIVYTVSYSGGHPPNKQEGTLTRGLSARVKKGMVFNVTRTDRS